MSSVLDRVGVGVVALCAIASALLEVLLVPLYVGSVVLPIAVLLAVVGNWFLPRLARVFVDRTAACAVPFVAWLVVVLGFGVVARPEGDVILPGGTGPLHWVTYGVLLGGALVGTVSVVTAVPPRSRPRPMPSDRREPVSR